MMSSEEQLTGNQRTQTAAAKEARSGRSVGGGKEEIAIKVLMIEDDEYYFRFVRQLLIRRSYPQFELAHGRNLAEATQQLLWETPDVILLDLHLPDSSGLASLSKVKELSNGAPIIILTGSDDESIGLEAVGLGAQDYLVKHQVGNDSLVRCLLYAIERRKSEESTLRQAAIRDFTATLAHDLKVPLIGTNNVFDAFLAGQFGELSAEQMRVMSDLKESNRNQLHLVEKLLEVYRYEAGAPDLQFKSLSITALVSGFVSQFRARAARPVSIETFVPEGLPELLGDKEALFRLFTNLLDNAVAFGDASKPVTVSAELRGTKLAISVHNTGPAIPHEVQVELFQKFWQGMPGKSYVAHTGLGLYLCHRIVSLHRGRITCHSSPPEGTTITVKLPVVLVD